jgi:hypothetical protein
MENAERAVTDALRANFAAGVALPIEELLRREVEALAELLDASARLTAGRPPSYCCRE